MNVLVLGAGGREHTIAWKINQSKGCEALFVAPGNGGTASVATNLPIGVNDFVSIRDAINKYQIDLLVIGPEDPLVNGIVDFLKASEGMEKLRIVGPDKAGAQLEGSKDFAKQFMNKYGIPTAKAAVFDRSTLKEGLAYLDEISGPYVLKADGLAAGKGVIICREPEEARANLREMLDGKFGEASSQVLIEEFLDGIELSVFALTDGKSYVRLPEAKDYKRIGEGDTGPNTGGMGAISPVIFCNEEFMKKVEERIIQPTIAGIQTEGFDFRGFVFFGLMNRNGDPYVIEYNVRMGDPETEVVIPRLRGDFLELLVAAAEGDVEKARVSIDPVVASTVVLVSEGYPGSYEKGRSIKIDQTDSKVELFHAGTRDDGGDIVTNGGRVMAVTGFGNDLTEALSNSYQGVKSIHWEGKSFRSDIGFDLKELGQ